jgi:hypothetical protein
MRHTSRIVPQSHLRSAAALLPEHGADISRRYFLNIELSRPQDPERALGGLASRRENDGPPISVDPADTASPSPRVDMLSVRPPTSEAITATASKLVQQSVQQDASAPPLMETPAQQESTLSQAGNEAPGRLVAPTTSPDPVPAGAAVEAQHATAIPTNTAADSAFDVAERAAGGGKPTNDAGISMAQYLPFSHSDWGCCALSRKMSQRGTRERSSITASPIRPTINASMTGAVIKISADLSMNGS